MSQNPVDKNYWKIINLKVPTFNWTSDRLKSTSLYLNLKEGEFDSFSTLLRRKYLKDCLLSKQFIYGGAAKFWVQSKDEGYLYSIWKANKKERQGTVIANICDAKPNSYLITCKYIIFKLL